MQSSLEKRKKLIVIKMPSRLVKNVVNIMQKILILCEKRQVTFNLTTSILLELDTVSIIWNMIVC